ncbi:YifB family Mg chelatase-like AAA ATPase [Neobacillus jeddahensis]|uniref:YifB family Mg chelatase-like AAA ATPase n=1 Tax=Neobacillus jeddahensis TaxID=1461580 RepID=UPI00058E1ED6|nr:ATP-binding protein [Neobacillus jeddahensis]
MTVIVSSIGLKGLEGYRVQVEVRIRTGTESMVIVGLPDASVKESRERVVAALGHFDVDVTDQKVVVNLSPSEQKKNGPLFVNSPQKDFQHVIGHEQAKRALEIAAAGEHNVLMSGPPGCGKSLLAETFPSILPNLTNQAQLEVMSLYQLAGERRIFHQNAPFRHPHHSASSVAIIGGGSTPRPGEISLAHRGVLFLDEIAEFTKKTIDMLRQPLETGQVTISRAHSTVTYPSNFILIGAMNPCPCGYLASNHHYCTCSHKQIQAYRNRISGPVYDRLDILLPLQSINLDQPSKRLESSNDIRNRVEEARQRQYQRYQTEVSNAKAPFEIITQTSPITSDQQKMLTTVAVKKNWSNRVQIKIIRLARTISDLAGEDHITDTAIWEAMTLRRQGHHKQQSIARET